MFDERYYPIKTEEGIMELPSVTTILRVANKEGLNIWRAKAGWELSEQISEETAEIGKQIHSYVAGFIKGIAISQLEWNTLSEEIKNGIRAYERFRLQVKFEGMETEKMVYSVKYKFAGTLDAIGKIGKDKILIDFKTGERFYPSMFAQIVAYHQAWKENNPEQRVNERVKELFIVNLSRNTGVPNIHSLRLKRIKPYWDYFKACLNLFNCAKQIELL